MRTTHHLEPRDYTPEGRARRLPNMTGTVTDMSNSHGLCFQVQYARPPSERLQFGWFDPDELVHLRSTSPIFCEHANEVPGRCPCDDHCYCRQPGNTCWLGRQRHDVIAHAVSVLTCKHADTPFECSCSPECFCRLPNRYDRLMEDDDVQT